MLRIRAILRGWRRQEAVAGWENSGEEWGVEGIIIDINVHESIHMDAECGHCGDQLNQGTQRRCGSHWSTSEKVNS